jgi:WD40 repeat protein
MKRTYLLALVGSVATLLATRNARAEIKGDPTFSPGGSILVMSYENGTVKFTRVGRGDRKVITLYKPVVRDGLEESELSWTPRVQFSPDGKLLATQRGDEPIVVWSMPTGRHVATLRTGGVVASMHFSPTGKVLAGLSYQHKASGKNTLTTWDVRTGKVRGWCRTPAKVEFLTVAFSRDGTTLLAFDSNGLLTFHDLKDRKEKRRLPRGKASGGK